MKAFLFAATSLIALASPTWAAEPIERFTVDTMQTFKISELDWQPEASLPPGAESVLLAGDPGKAGMFIVLLKFPAEYSIPAHSHPFTESVTVLKGSVAHGMGKQPNKQGAERLHAGDSFILPADHPHYLWTDREETLVQLVATGPWGITYLNPADDPRQAPAKQ